MDTGSLWWLFFLTQPSWSDLRRFIRWIHRDFMIFEHGVPTTVAFCAAIWHWKSHEIWPAESSAKNKGPDGPGGPGPIFQVGSNAPDFCRISQPSEVEVGEAWNSQIQSSDLKDPMLKAQPLLCPLWWHMEATHRSRINSYGIFVVPMSWILQLASDFYNLQREGVYTAFFFPEHPKKHPTKHPTKVTKAWISGIETHPSCWS